MMGRSLVLYIPHGWAADLSGVQHRRVGTAKSAALDGAGLCTSMMKRSHGFELEMNLGTQYGRQAVK